MEDLSKLKDLSELETEAKEVLDIINDQILEEDDPTLVKCESSSIGDGCGQALEITDLVYIQTHYYVPPNDSEEGDYWSAGEGRFICSSCGCINRLYNRPSIEGRKKLFKSVKNEYKA